MTNAAPAEETVRVRRRRNGLVLNNVLGLGLVAASVLPAVINPGPVGPAGPSAPSPPAAASRDARGTTAGAPVPPASAPTGGPRIFFGNLHAHTKYSDGSGTPADAFRMARDEAKLDFLAVTEHNHKAAEMGIKDKEHPNSPPRKDGVMVAVDPRLYNGADAASLLSAARSFTADGRFVALAAQEFSTISSGNHASVFDVGKVIDENEVKNGDFAALYDRWLPQNPDSLKEPPLVQFNHPDYRGDTERKGKDFNDYGLDDYGGNFEELVKHAEKYVSLIEMVSGPAITENTGLAITSDNRHEKDYWFYLNKGFRLAPTANQDNHFFTWGTSTRARTAVLADRLTAADILRALKARRVYATEDDNLQIRVTVEGRPMGSVIRTPGPKDFDIEVAIADPDEPNARYKIELFSDEVGGDMIAEAAEESRLDDGDGSVTFTVNFKTGRSYHFVKVSQVGSGGVEEFAWTAPVWIETGQPEPTPGPVGGPSPQPPPAAGFVHSVNSEIYHEAGCADVERIKPENRIFSETPPEDKTLHRNCPRKPSG